MSSQSTNNVAGVQDTNDLENNVTDREAAPPSNENKKSDLHSTSGATDESETSSDVQEDATADSSNGDSPQTIISRRRALH